ncbi:MAG: type II toxin-antitoxin system RelE/ParE family toxin [Candidatus Sericytochromatia bacterium]
MIITFGNKETEQFYKSGKSKSIPSNIQKVAIRKLDYLRRAISLQDLLIPPANRLEALKGNYSGKYSIRINDQYRIVFRFENGNAYEVEIIDYH